MLDLKVGYQVELDHPDAVLKRVEAQGADNLKVGAVTEEVFAADE